MKGRIVGWTLASFWLLVLVASPVAVARAHVSRSKRLPLAPGTRYLALGDSVTFGYEEGGVTPKPNYHDAASFIGYPEQIAREIHVKVANAACPGETSASFIDPRAQSNGCENFPGSPHAGYRTAFPLHVHYPGSQLAFALHYLRAHRRVRLVSLMIGANDGFICRQVTADHCAGPAEQQAVFDRVSHNVRRILSAIRNHAHYRGQIVIVNYYSLDYASAATSASVRKLNAAQDQAARPFHVKIANGFREFFLQARNFGGDVCAAGLITRLSSSSCGVHPTFSGQGLLSDAVLHATRL